VTRQGVPPSEGGGPLLALLTKGVPLCLDLLAVDTVIASSDWCNSGSSANSEGVLNGLVGVAVAPDEEVKLKLLKIDTVKLGNMFMFNYLCFGPLW
jgi:hypothetical protein